MCKVARGRVLRRTERKAPREAAPWRPERRGSEADSARRRGAWGNAGANPSGARRGGSSRGRAHTRATGQRRPSGGFARSARLPEQETTGASRSTWRPGAGGHGTPSRRASANPGCRRKGSSEPAEPAETLGLVKINFENYGEMQTCSDQQKHFLTGGPAF